jgi:hypothetical protein
MLQDNAPYGQMLHHTSVADKGRCSEGGLPTNIAKGHTFLCQYLSLEADIIHQRKLNKPICHYLSEG